MSYVHPTSPSGHLSPSSRYNTSSIFGLWASLALVLLWDAGNGDMAVMHWLGSDNGFANSSTVSLVHAAQRWMAWVVLGAMAWQALVTPLLKLFFVSQHTLLSACSLGPTPSAQQRRYALWVTLFCIGLIVLIKRASTTSCPSNLIEFGGVAAYVSHWNWSLISAEAGHCFPSGHSSAAFCFFTLYFLWRDHSAARARFYLAAVCVAGAVFGTTQIVRGAHYPSHVLWSAWFCWAVPWALMRGWVAKRP